MSESTLIATIIICVTIVLLTIVVALTYNSNQWNMYLSSNQKACIEKNGNWIRQGSYNDGQCMFFREIK